jgi:putative nucleotidyltransferase with HDIG domain
MRQDLATFMEQTSKPPRLPASYYELVEVMEREPCPHTDLSDLILRDSNLAGRVLRLANSAFYAHPVEIVTISAAIQLVGVREVQSLALACAVIGAFDRLPDDQVDVQAFWEHSIACGLGGALLFETRQGLLPERLFIGGLIHDVGRLLMFQNAPDESREILERCQAEGQVSCKIEQEILGFDHTAVGAELARWWNLPRLLVDIVQGHHSPLPSSSAPVETLLIHYSDFVANVLQLGDAGEPYVSPLVVPSGYERYLPLNGTAAFIGQLEHRCQEITPILLDDNPQAATAAA